MVVVVSRPRKKKNPFFMKWSKMPSIMGFSMILLFYGGKNEMKWLLFQLAKGGRNFFNDKVKKGYFFKQNVRESNHIFFNKQCHLLKFNQLKADVKTGGNPP